MRLIATMVALLVCGWAATAASFDCGRAHTPSERSICADATLSRLDAQVAHAYWQALAIATTEQREALKREQRLWLAQRDASKTLRASMQQRLQHLRAGLSTESLQSLEPQAQLAFDFLLSMPQAAPDEGSWEIEPPPEFAPNEAALQRYLARRFQHGANINAYRFDGTLLHHAIRAGLQSTALWLLQQGADPSLGIEPERLRSDAMSLSIRYQRWAVFDALRVLDDQPSAARAEAGWMQAPTREAMRELWQRGFPWPSGDARRCLLQRALEDQLFDVAAALPERDPWAIAMDDGRFNSIWWRWQCRNAAHKTQDFRAQERTVGGFATLDESLLVKLDAELQQPLLPYLLPTLSTPNDVERLFAMKLRLPSEDPTFIAKLLKRALNLALDAPSKTALLRRIPPDALQHSLQDDELLTRWIIWARGQSAVDFAWALQAIGAPPLDGRAAVILHAMVDPRAWHSAAAHANWAPLLASCAGPLARDALPQLLRASKPVNWAALFALGYRPQNEEIQSWLQNAATAELREGWPLLGSEATLSQNALEWLLAPQRPPLCSAVLTNTDVEKAQLLLELGAHKPQPLLFCGLQRRAAQSSLDALAQMGLVAQQEVQPRFAAAALQCKQVLAGPLCDALDAGKVDGPGSFHIDDSYPVELPGTSQCALLVQGNSASSWRREEDIYEPTFTSGRVPAPWPSCPDPEFVHRLWQVMDGKLQTQTLPLLDQWPARLEFPLLDTQTGRRYYLAVQYLGRCGEDSARLLSFSADGQLVEADAEVLQALEQQCELPLRDQKCLLEEPKDG